MVFIFTPERFIERAQNFIKMIYLQFRFSFYFNYLRAFLLTIYNFAFATTGINVEDEDNKADGAVQSSQHNTLTVEIYLLINL